MVCGGKQLGIDQINFKQCDVIRGEYGKGLGLYGQEEDPQVRKYEADLAAARKLAGTMGIKIMDFSFFPQEQPVCEQDPRNSIFIRYDGSVVPCINLAFGGPTQFMGRVVDMPTVHYGRPASRNNTVALKFFRVRSVPGSLRGKDGGILACD